MRVVTAPYPIHFAFSASKYTLSTARRSCFFEGEVHKKCLIWKRAKTVVMTTVVGPVPPTTVG